MIITISGLPGSGKTTVAKKLSKKLNYEFISVGDLKGQFAKEKGMTIDEFMRKCSPEEVHQKVDDYQKNIGKTKKEFIIEGWLAYHFIPNSFKIFLDVQDEVSAERVFKDQREDEKKCDTREEVKKMLEERLKISDEQFYKCYGIRFLKKSNYDLVIDTTKISPNEVLGKILYEIKNV